MKHRETNEKITLLNKASEIHQPNSGKIGACTIRKKK